MICDLTALPIAGASLLDEGTAAAEAMAMCIAQHRRNRMDFFVASDCHPQTIEVLKTSASGTRHATGDRTMSRASMRRSVPVGRSVLVQYPGTDGVIRNFKSLAESAHADRSTRGRRRSRSDGAVSAGPSGRMGGRHRSRAPPSASAFPWDTADPTRHTSHAAKHSFERCRDD